MIPFKIVGDFSCTDKGLTTLEGCPKEITKNFYIYHNNLTSLENGPDSVRGSISCFGNNLKNLYGCPLNANTIIINFGAKDKNFFDLYVEEHFIESDKYLNKETYWQDLLKFMIDEKIDLDEVFGWPENFLNQEIIDSVKGISKFNL